AADFVAPAPFAFYLRKQARPPVRPGPIILQLERHHETRKHHRGVAARGCTNAGRKHQRAEESSVHGEPALCWTPWPMSVAVTVAPDPRKLTSPSRRSGNTCTCTAR